MLKDDYIEITSIHLPEINLHELYFMTQFTNFLKTVHLLHLWRMICVFCDTMYYLNIHNDGAAKIASD